MPYIIQVTRKFPANKRPIDAGAELSAVIKFKATYETKTLYLAIKHASETQSCARWEPNRENATIFACEAEAHTIIALYGIQGAKVVNLEFA